MEVLQNSSWEDFMSLQSKASRRMLSQPKRIFFFFLTLETAFKNKPTAQGICKCERLLALHSA